jgi:hypothetical protein
MNLTQFLHFNHDCPVCGEPLTLYAQILDGSLWAATKESPSIYRFKQMPYTASTELSPDDFFWIDDNADSTDFQMTFSSPKIYQKSKIWNFYLFFLCNKNSIEESVHEGYGINPYNSCYYRSSSFCEFKKGEDDVWRIAPVGISQSTESDLSTEVFTFITQLNTGQEKVFVLDLDYENKNTVLRSFTVTPEEKAQADFEPLYFKKELPLLSVRPDLTIENRERLTDRLNSWILLS